MTASSPRIRKRLRQASVMMGVCVAHVLVLFSLSRGSGDLLLEPPLPSIEVVLIDPPPPPPPPPPAEAETSGGGAPAAPSVVRLPPEPVDVTPEIIAPPEPAPEQPPIVVGASNLPGETPAQGQGGQGTGVGGGQGSGVGRGQGVRRGPWIIREPRPADLRTYHPREALEQRISGVGVVRCRIRRDSRLERCSVMSETPSGFGFGQAALAAARDLYRFQPATLDGYYDDSVSTVVTIEFGRGRGRDE